MSGEPKQFFVYILASRSRTLYVGVTSDIVSRVHQHKTKETPGFTSRYNVERLVYVEQFNTAAEAIEREKQIKAWRRSHKVALIEEVNPLWNDLSKGW
jgi:putative endonuclease